MKLSTVALALLVTDVSSFQSIRVSSVVHCAEKQERWKFRAKETLLRSSFFNKSMFGDGKENITTGPGRYNKDDKKEEEDPESVKESLDEVQRMREEIESLRAELALLKQQEQAGDTETAPVDESEAVATAEVPTESVPETSEAPQAEADPATAEPEAEAPAPTDEPVDAPPEETAVLEDLVEQPEEAEELFDEPSTEETAPDETTPEPIEMSASVVEEAPTSKPSPDSLWDNFAPWLPSTVKKDYSIWRGGPTTGRKPEPADVTASKNIVEPEAASITEMPAFETEEERLPVTDDSFLDTTKPLEVYAVVSPNTKPGKELFSVQDSDKADAKEAEEPVLASATDLSTPEVEESVAAKDLTDDTIELPVAEPDIADVTEVSLPHDEAVTEVTTATDAGDLTSETEEESTKEEEAAIMASSADLTDAVLDQAPAAVEAEPPTVSTMEETEPSSESSEDESLKVDTAVEMKPEDKEEAPAPAVVSEEPTPVVPAVEEEIAPAKPVVATRETESSSESTQDEPLKVETAVEMKSEEKEETPAPAMVSEEPAPVVPAVEEEIPPATPVVATPVRAEEEDHASVHVPPPSQHKLKPHEQAMPFFASYAKSLSTSLKRPAPAEEEIEDNDEEPEEQDSPEEPPVEIVEAVKALDEDFFESSPMNRRSRRRQRQMKPAKGMGTKK